jgi:vitamin B12 transporter
LFVRGGESDYVQVLIDGVQVNDPGGSFDWAHLRTEDIERVEIVRGPSSVLYGSDAVSGVIQVFTRAGGAPRIEAGMTGARGCHQSHR